MRRKLWASITAGVLVVTLSALGCGQKLAATVNGRKIYLEDVDKQYDQMKSQHGETPGAQGAEAEKNFKNAILDQFIKNELLLDYAQKNKITVTKKETDEALKRIKSSFPSVQAYNDRLKELKMTEEDLKKRLDQDLVLNKVNEKIYKGLKVTDDEAKKSYDENPDQFKEQEQVKLRQIVLEEETKAKEVLAKLKGGASFEEIAKAESKDDETKNQGGDLGFRTRQLLSKELADAAFALKPGSVSDVVKSEAKFYILRVDEKKPEKQRSYEESKEQAKQIVLGQKQRKKYESFVSDLKKKAKIKKFM